MARRERRTLVERLLLDGKSFAAVCAATVEAFGVSARTVRVDVDLVRKRWEREDRAWVVDARRRVVRRLERLAVTAEASGDLGAAVSANTALARVLGLGLPGGSVNILQAQVGADGKPMLSVVDLVRTAEAHDRASGVPSDEALGGALGILDRARAALQLQPKNDPEMTDPGIREARNAYVRALAGDGREAPPPPPPPPPPRPTLALPSGLPDDDDEDPRGAVAGADVP